MSPTAENSTPKIHEVMHPGLIDCPPQTPVSEVGSLMAEHNVHCVVVDGLARDRHHNEQFVWGILSDVELMRALSDDRAEDQVGSLAATEIVTIAPEDDAYRAAQLMSEHECSHLVVVDSGSGRPVGVISSLDVARALSRGVIPRGTASANDGHARHAKPVEDKRG